MRIVVTGSAGFIGSHLVAKLLKEGHIVAGIDNLNSYYDTKLKDDRLKNISDFIEQKNINMKNYSFEKIDLKFFPEVYNFLSSFRPDVIYHLAAQAGVRYSLENPHSYIDNNLNATVNLLESSAQLDINKIIFASSSSVYGTNDKVPFKEDMVTDTPVSTYAASKKSCELLCFAYHNLYKINFNILRLFTVYGPWGRPDMAPFIFTKSIIDRQAISVFNKGEMKRDFTYIDDVVDGFVLCLDNNYGYEIFNIGNGKTVELKEFIRITEDLVGIKAKKNYQPNQKGDVLQTFSSTKKAKDMIGYEPKFTIEKGMEFFVNWYLDYYKISL